MQIDWMWLGNINNSASVCTNFGAQEGFLTFDEIETKLKSAKNFEVKIYKAEECV